ncbi:MAG: metallophosphoesterase [Bacteroidota bacterium]
MRIAQITDHHLTVDGSPFQGIDNEGRWLAALEEAKKLDANYLLLTGDFCAQEPVEQVYERVKAHLDTIGLPFMILAGNHDDRSMIRQYFDISGESDEPIYQHLHLNGYDWLLLDSSQHYVDDEQLNWLKQELEASPKPIIAIHHPPCLMGADFMDKHYPLQNWTEVMQALHDADKPISVFCGHYHFSLQAQISKVNVYCAAPTSFFIHPIGEEIAFIEKKARVQLIELEEEQLLVRSMEV